MDNEKEQLSKIGERKSIEKPIQENGESKILEGKKKSDPPAQVQKRYDQFSLEVPLDHAYLVKKRIKKVEPELRYDPEFKNLIIPIYNIEGHVRSYQRIQGDGQKFYAKGSIPDVFFYDIKPKKKSNWIYICEGWATGKAINAITGASVFLAFQMNKIEKLTKHLVNSSPELNVCVCLDNDGENTLKPKFNHPHVRYLVPDEKGDFWDYRENETEKKKLRNRTINRDWPHEDDPEFIKKIKNKVSEKAKTFETEKELEDHLRTAVDPLLISPSAKEDIKGESFSSFLVSAQQKEPNKRTHQIPLLKQIADMAIKYRIPIFPCNEHKKPLIKDWEKNASYDRTMIKTWYEHFTKKGTLKYWGMPTKTIMAIDHDIDKKTLKSDMGKIKQASLSENPFYQDTQSGGRHYFYKNTHSLRNKVRFTGTWDTRGAGGYVCIYQVIFNEVLKPQDLHELPEDILNLLKVNTNKANYEPGTRNTSLNLDSFSGDIEKIVQGMETWKRLKPNEYKEGFETLLSGLKGSLKNKKPQDKSDEIYNEILNYDESAQFEERYNYQPSSWDNGVNFLQKEALIHLQGDTTLGKSKCFLQKYAPEVMKRKNRKILYFTDEDRKNKIASVINHNGIKPQDVALWGYINPLKNTKEMRKTVIEILERYKDEPLGLIVFDPPHAALYGKDENSSMTVSNFFGFLNLLINYYSKEFEGLSIISTSNFNKNETQDITNRGAGSYKKKTAPRLGLNVLQAEYGSKMWPFEKETKISKFDTITKEAQRKEAQANLPEKVSILHNIKASDFEVKNLKTLKMIYQKAQWKYEILPFYPVSKVSLMCKRTKKTDHKESVLQFLYDRGGEAETKKVHEYFEKKWKVSNKTVWERIRNWKAEISFEQGKSKGESGKSMGNVYKIRAEKMAFLDKEKQS